MKAKALGVEDALLLVGLLDVAEGALRDLAALAVAAKGHLFQIELCVVCVSGG